MVRNNSAGDIAMDAISEVRTPATALIKSGALSGHLIFEGWIGNIKTDCLGMHQQNSKTNSKLHVADIDMRRTKALVSGHATILVV